MAKDTETYWAGRSITTRASDEDDSASLRTLLQELRKDIRTGLGEVTTKLTTMSNKQDELAKKQDELSTRLLSIEQKQSTLQVDNIHSWKKLIEPFHFFLFCANIRKTAHRE